MTVPENAEAGTVRKRWPYLVNPLENTLLGPQTTAPIPASAITHELPHQQRFSEEPIFLVGTPEWPRPMLQALLVALLGGIHLQASKAKKRS